MQKAHDKLVNILGHRDTSPSAMAYKMLHESKYVNESMLQYIISYVTMMAKSKIVPQHLEDIKEVCVYLHDDLEELGLTGSYKYTR